MTILRWLRTIVLAVIGFIILIAYSSAYQTVYIRTPAALFRSDFLPLILLLINGLPFLAGLMLGLAAFNGPIRGLKFSIVNFAAIALLPLLFGCGISTLVAAGLLIRPLGQVVSTFNLFRSPMFAALQPLAIFIAGAGIGLAFTRGLIAQQQDPSPEAVAAPPASE
jgi:predicted lysophospholipase L1 biosynthesis ABC-type transport system permease subunit